MPVLYFASSIEGTCCFVAFASSSSLPLYLSLPRPELKLKVTDFRFNFTPIGRNRANRRT